MTSPSLVDVDDVRAEVDALLVAHVDGLRRELGATGEPLSDLLDGLGAMLSGGKRLRAAFCYWSWVAHDGPALVTHGPGRPATRRDVLRIGAALELFQAAALFHDDVMDASDTRRGRPSAHRAFEALHRTHDWKGPAERFGEAAAILLGDLALIASERETSAALEPLASSVRAGAREVFDVMRTEVTVGQYLDVHAQAVPWGQDPVADEARARAVIRSKSARYSVEHPLALGARLAGADDPALARVAAAGLPLGEAFQLRDDLLGVFGDPSATGKPAGDDLREGKRTVLVARAMQHCDAEGAALVLRLLGRRDLTDHQVGLLREVITGSGAVEAVEQLISGLAEPALAQIADSDLTEPGRTMLMRLGTAAVVRTS